jgi:hypothetical protein
MFKFKRRNLGEGTGSGPGRPVSSLTPSCPRGAGLTVNLDRPPGLGSGTATTVGSGIVGGQRDLSYSVTYTSFTTASVEVNTPTSPSRLTESSGDFATPDLTLNYDAEWRRSGSESLGGGSDAEGPRDGSAADRQGVADHLLRAIPTPRRCPWPAGMRLIW